MVQIGINLQAGQDALTDNFINQAGYEIVANDTNRDLARRFQPNGQPIFAIINGVANSPSHAQWELLLHQNGYGTTQHPIDLFRSVIDSVQAPVGLLPPIIAVQPQNQTVTLGANVMFSVTAEGTESLAYQWRFNGADIEGAVTAALGLTNVQLDAVGAYTVVVSNAAGSTSSNPAELTLALLPPYISAEPQSQMTTVGSLVTFEVVASGAEPLSYQWQFNGADIPGAIGAALNLTNVQPDASGSYVVVVSNASGSVVSEAAELNVRVTPVEPSHIDRIEFEAGLVTIVFRSVPNSEIVVEFKESLAPGSWTILESFAADGDSSEVRVVDSALISERRFYRLRVVE